MRLRTRHGRTPNARRPVLLLALACGAALNFSSTLSVNRASAQTAAQDKIAFHREGEIVVANPDGTGAVTLGPGFDPSWSKTGKIAFTFAPDVETTLISVMNDDGTGKQDLTIAQTGNRNAAFSPDGSKIAYVTETVEPEDPPFQGSLARIYVMDAGGQNQRRFFAGNAVSGMRQEFEPAWSPDGTKIAFVGETVVNGLSSHDVYVANADGQTAPVNITNLGGVKIFRDQLAWSPDGLKIAFTTARDIHIINADGSGGMVNLTNSSRSDDTDPAWSPDGEKIVYSSNNFDDAALDGLYIMDADGQNQTFLNTEGSAPTWRPRDTEPQPTPTPTPEPTPAAESDIAVQLTASPNQPSVNQNLIYTLVVRNDGAATAENVQANLIRSASLELVSASPAQGSCEQTGGNPVLCQLGQLAAGAQTSIQFVFKATATGEVVAFSGANSPTPDSNPNNNQQELRLNVVASCVPEVTGEVQQLIVRPGNQSRQRVKHRIFVRNNSGRALHGLVHFVFDGLPASVQDGDPRSTFFETRCAAPLGRKYTSVGVRDLIWQPGQVIPVEVDFFNPDRVRIDYNLRVYTGPGFP